MRRLELDFRRHDQTARQVGIAVLALTLVGAAGMGYQFQRVNEELTVAEAAVHKHGLAMRKKAVPQNSEDAQRVAQQAKRANDVLAQLRMPWPELFANVEAAQTPDVALLSIESVSDKRNIKIAGEAKNLGAVLTYLRDLQEQPMLADVYLESHQVQQQDPQHPVRFALGAGWRSQPDRKGG
jgi:Tfp pilus assembly protein PilN